MRPFAHLFLLRELVRRDVQGRYAGSFLGFLWSFVQPLWQLVLFWLVFGKILTISLLGERTDSFAVFLFCGLLPWMAVNEAVLRGTTAITDNAALVKKLRFPSEVLVLGITLAALVHEAIAGAVFLVVLGGIGELSLASLPWLVPALVMQTLLALGLALGLAGLHVFFRDMVQVVGMVLTGWFYATPIVYPLTMVDEPYRSWLELNPLTGLVGLYRKALLGGQGGADVDLWLLGTVSVVTFALGAWIFRRLRPSFVDVI